MDASGFLRLVWPTAGLYIIAIPAGKGYRHHFFETIDAAARAAESFDKQGNDVYFALATAKTHKTVDAEGKAHYRTKDNMAALRTLFAEVDVAKPGEWETLNDARRATKYETAQDALNALKGFCTQINWPLPTLVSSGWGLHCYWLIEEAIPADTYEEVATLLKRVSRATGFRLDTQALNVTQVLRVVGTHNHKRADAVRRVELLKEGRRHNHLALLDALRRASATFGIEAPAAKEAQESTPDYLDFGATNTEKQYDNAPVPFEALRACQVVKSLEDLNGNAPYEHWWRVGQLMQHVVDGRAHYHRISSGGPTYTVDGTDLILDRFERNKVGPTLCTTISDGTNLCGGCPHWGQIRSPISLGRRPVSIPVVTEIEADELFSIPAVTVTLPAAPAGYAVTEKGVFTSVENADGKVVPIHISPYPITPVRRVYQERTKTEAMVWKVTLPMDGTIEFSFSSAQAYDAKALATLLANDGIYIEYRNLAHIRDYMLAYAQELQQTTAREQRYSHLGWRADGTQFVLGQRLFEGGVPRACDVEDGNRILPAVVSAGTLDAWKAAFDMYNHRQFIPHQFALATAFGSPLLRFTVETGGVINILGKSGEGKSTIQRVVNSVWGHPQTLMLPASGQRSTINAKMAILAMMHNLPVCAEEITDTPPPELGSLLYCVSEGVNKIRVNRDGSMKEDTGSWRLTMLSSSNDSITEKLFGESGSAAKELRVLEYRLPMVRLHGTADFREKVARPIMENYGLAGPIYAAYLTKHADKLQALVESVFRQLESALDMGQEERIWVSIAAANLAGFMLAKKCGLHTMEVEPLFDFVVHQIKHMRGRASDAQYTADESLAEYINLNMRNILVVESPPHGVKTHTRIIKDPMGSVCARYDVDNGLMWVATGPFKEWCVKNGRVYSDLIAGLIESGTLRDRKSTKVLGANTHYASGQVRCLVVNTLTHAFSGVAPKELPEAKVVPLKKGDLS